MIYTGTSGFQYPEWKGSFYPENFSTAKMLLFYSERFSTTEINYSFYRIPTAKTLERWSVATPENFRFSFKAPKEITHTRKLRDCEDVLARFAGALGVIKPKLGVVLFQLPPFFKKDSTLLESFLDSLPKELKYAFEFRHDSWFDDDIFAALKKRNVALCIAESETLSTPLMFTAGFGYFRLRRKDYTKNDISRWSKVIANQENQLAEIYIYFKHEERGVGPKFAKEMIAELGGETGH
jgi:uncharacterized protein YecE (DUF72 family)